MTKQKVYPYSLQTDYSVCHVSDDMRTLQSILPKVHPEYIASFARVILCANKLSPTNMFVMRWEMFDQYAAWLFSVLDECQRRIDISSYSAVQVRIFGYMAERLFNVWADYQRRRGAKVKRLPVVMFTDKPNTFGTLYHVFNTIAYLPYALKSPLIFKRRVRQLERGK